MHTRHRQLHRVSRAALLVALGLALFPTNARAATKLGLDKSAWFWSSNQDITTCPSAPSPAPATCAGGSLSSGVFGNGGGTVSPISPGHMGVSMKNGSSDMRAYLHFDTSALPAGAVIHAFVVTLSVSQTDTAHGQEHATFAQSGQGHAPATTNNAAASIVACAVKQPFGDNMAGGAGGDPPYSSTVTPPTDTADHMAKVDTTKNEPYSDCSLNAGGSPSSDGKTWTFNITNIAQAWAAGTIFNEGIALLPQNSGLNSTWTVEFHGAPLTLSEKTGDVQFVSENEAAFATVDFEEGDGSTPPPPPPPTGDCCAVPLPTIDTGPIPAPIVDLPPPQVEGTQISKALPSVPVAFTGKPPAWVFGLFALLLLGMALMARVIGVDPIGFGIAAQGSRIAAVLHERRLGGERPSAAAEAIKAEEEQTEL